MPGPAKISVIVPSLNQGRFLEENLRSLLDQKYPALEIIVIDGGSNDNSVEVIRKFATSLSYWVSEPDSGQSQAINKGLKRATGEIITWLNSDDSYKPGALQRVSDAFAADPDLEMLHGRALLFGEKLRSRVVGPAGTLSVTEYLSYMRFPQPSAFMRAKTWKENGPLNEALHYAMDFELVVKAVLHGAKISGVPDILSSYRLHADSKSNDEERFIEEWTRVLQHALNSFPEATDLQNLLFSVTGVRYNEQFSFPRKININRSGLIRVVLEHLHHRFHSAYRRHDPENCRIIANVIRTLDSAYYRDRALAAYLLRMKIIPGFIYKLKTRMFR